MGLIGDIFGAIWESVEEASKNMVSENNEASSWSPTYICQRLDGCGSSITKLAAYSAALKDKCRGMGSRELRDLYSSQYYSKNYKSCRVIKEVMDDRGI